MKKIIEIEKGIENNPKQAGITFNQVVGGSNPPCLIKIFFNGYFEIDKSKDFRKEVLFVSQNFCSIRSQEKKLRYITHAAKKNEAID